MKEIRAKIVKFFFEKSFSLFMCVTIITIIIYDHIWWRAILGMITATFIDVIVINHIERMEYVETMKKVIRFEKEFKKILHQKNNRVEKENHEK